MGKSSSPKILTDEEVVALLSEAFDKKASGEQFSPPDSFYDTLIDCCTNPDRVDILPALLATFQFLTGTRESVYEGQYITIDLNQKVIHSSRTKTKQDLSINGLSSPVVKDLIKLKEVTGSAGDMFI